MLRADDVCREEMQEAQWQAAKANLVPCRNCQRRFAADRVHVHERACKGDNKRPAPNNASHRDTATHDRDKDVKGQYKVGMI